MEFYLQLVFFFFLTSIEFFTMTAFSGYLFKCDVYSLHSAALLLESILYECMWLEEYALP